MRPVRTRLLRGLFVACLLLSALASQARAGDDGNIDLIPSFPDDPGIDFAP